MASQKDERADVEFSVPIRFRKGALIKDQRASVGSAIELIEMMAAELGVPDLANTEVLDIGCGVKLTQAFYGRKIPVKHYHGVDVDRSMIEFLSENVVDSHFSYKYINVYNARYHKNGEKPLSVETDIGVGERRFDLICLFSVFTHLDPDDFRTMLSLCRKYVSCDGTLIFTSFIDDTILGAFLDSEPSQPLWKMLYRESSVRNFVSETKWSVKRIFRPGRRQHRIVCNPT